MLTEINRSRYIPQSKLTLAEYVPKWIEGIEGRLQPHTAKFYDQIIEYYILPEIGDMQLQEIKPKVLRTLFNKRPTLEKHIKGPLSACLSVAVKNEIIADNPASR